MKQQQGVGLIEILITLVVITIGLLGMAGLQLHGLRNSQVAYWQTQATIISYDLIDRMRANRSIAAHGGYQIGRSETVNTPQGCYKKRCSAHMLAQLDLAHWKQSLAQNLPGGDGEVQLTMKEAGLEVQVTVWVEDKQNTPSATEFQVSTLL